MYDHCRYPENFGIAFLFDLNFEIEYLASRYDSYHQLCEIMMNQLNFHHSYNNRLCIYQNVNQSMYHNRTFHSEQDVLFQH